LLSEIDLGGRVTERARELGRSLADVLAGAGISRGFLNAKPQHGRRLDRLEALARELNWTLADLLGLKVTRIDPALLAKAVRMAGRLAQRRPEGGDRDQLIAGLAAAVYEWLARRAAEGQTVVEEDDEASLSLVEWVLDQFISPAAGR
jgi:hypothetical protein